MIHSIKEIISVSQELRLQCLNEDRQYQKRKNKMVYVSRGVLLGSFSNQLPIVFSDQFLFKGDFEGFFEEDTSNNQQEQEGSKEIYFQGKIHDLEIISINGDVNHPRKNDLVGCSFYGYFKGTIEKQHHTFILGYQRMSIEDLKNEKIIVQRVDKSYTIPVFGRFTLKNINSVVLDQAKAFVSGVLLIELQLTNNLMNHFQSVPDLSISMDLNKENTIELPLKKKGNQKDGQTDITYSYNSQTCILKYTIRKIFDSELQSSYKQFFVPFNLLYLKIVVSFLDLYVKYPEEQNAFFKESSFSKESQEDEKLKVKKDRKRKKKALMRSNKYVHFRFHCLDLEDYLEPNNPYTPYNDLWDRDMNLVINRTTKISFIKQIQCGDFKLSTNHLSLFPYYKTALFNTTRKNTNFYWSLGLQARHKDILLPEVHSIKTEFNMRSEDRNILERKVFSLEDWRNIHIDIPIYKYWVIYVIQICIPLLILAGISMFIFLQGNGQADGQSIFNLRIANATAILLAYVAMIPVFKDSTSKTNYFSFFYIIIYLAIIPLLLALISSIVDANVEVSEWEKTYDPFSDIFFLISFCFLMALLSIVFIVVLVASCNTLKNNQINYKSKVKKFKNMKQAQDPSGYHDYIAKVNIYRNHQYQYTKISDIDEFGKSVP